MFKKRRKLEAADGPIDAGDPENYVSSGWQSTEEVLAWLYGSTPTRQVNYALAGALNEHLQGCSVYAAADHWHYVSYGLSDLFRPATNAEPDRGDDPVGWGLELTMRVAATGSPEPPEWPFAVLGDLAKRVNEGTLWLQAGNRIDLRSAVTGYPNLPDGPATGLTVLAVMVDPQLGRVSTPNAEISFLQVVGITAAEKARMVGRSTAAVLEELAETNPLLITDPGRAQPI